MISLGAHFPHVAWMLEHHGPRLAWKEQELEVHHGLQAVSWKVLALAVHHGPQFSWKESDLAVHHGLQLVWKELGLAVHQPAWIELWVVVHLGAALDPIPSIPAIHSGHAHV